MKDALKVTIKRFHNSKLVKTVEKMHCAYCESGEVFVVKKQGAISCRKCGKLSRLRGGT